jgi:ubiquitin C-terminal hydrolase
MDLSVSIPRTISGSINLEECLENYIEKEKMGKCGYKCSNCKKIDNHEKNISIFRLPQILVIHLKRFTSRSKLTNTIKIPKKLNMSPYAPYSSKLIINI